MSAIAGYWNLDGEPACSEHLTAVLEPVKRRGPDGVTQFVSGPLAMGHACLASTPEAARETLPFTHSQSGCTILADARLDYRADLAGKLDLGGDHRPIGDGELILLAYLKWGPNCVEHFEGDFAFVINDPREKCLFCARDPIGMRRLAYAFRPDRVFAFATEPLAIVAHPAISDQVNPARIGDYLEGQEVFDLTSTFFTAVHRLPPAHAMIVGESGLKTWRYWEMAQPEPIHLSSNAEYADALRHALMQAVETRLRSNGPAASMLSGGMDSGSICALAAHLLNRDGRPELVTISATTSDPNCAESAAIAIARRMDNIDTRSVNLEDRASYSDRLAQLLSSLDDPFDWQMSALRAVYAEAQNAGFRMLLDGACGDTTLGPQDLPLWHIRHARLLTAWREIKSERWVYKMDQPAFTEMRRKVMTAMLPANVNHLRSQRDRRRRSKATAASSLIEEGFAQSIDMPERRDAYWRTLNQHLHSPLGDRGAKMLHPSVATARERYDRTAGACGIEPRDPFTDIRLMRLMMRFPIEQFRADGWHKVALRRAMKGWLPDEIRWRRGKEHIGYRFNRAFQLAGADDAAAVLDWLRPYVNPQTLGNATKRLKNKAGTDEDARLYHLALWLRRVRQGATQKDTA